MPLKTQVQAELDNWKYQLDGATSIRQKTGMAPEDVLDAHYYLVDFFTNGGKRPVQVGLFGPRSLGTLTSTVERQFAGYGSHDVWTEPIQYAATLFYGIIKNHPFHDINKRTALLVLLLHLKRIGRMPKVDQREWENFAVAIADDTIKVNAKNAGYKTDAHSIVEFIAHRIKQMTRRSNDEYRVITYNQLETTLKRFGYSFANKHKNSVDICRDTLKPSSLLGRLTSRPQKVMNIPYPGGCNEVLRSDMKNIREGLELTSKFGFDSDVFYDGADTLTKLIRDYETPLRNLADK